MLKRIRPAEATLGIYIHGFEGDWFSHPFWRGHFTILNEEDLSRVRHSGLDLIIDTDLGFDVDASPTASILHLVRPPLRNNPLGGIPSAAGERHPVQPNRNSVASLVAPVNSARADKVRATAVATRSIDAVRSVFEGCRAGEIIPWLQVVSIVNDIAETLAFSGSAFMGVTHMKVSESVTFAHSVSVCALMISLATTLNFPVDAVRNLGAAGLVHDIGKMRIDNVILNKVGPLSDVERSRIKLHPELGRDILALGTHVPDVVVDVCLHHHERLDGSGYPFGVRGDGITVAARMAAICDVYDAMTSNRPYQTVKSPADAVMEITNRPHEFDQQLLVHFMRCLGGVVAP